MDTNDNQPKDSTPVKEAPHPPACLHCAIMTAIGNHFKDRAEANSGLAEVNAGEVIPHLVSTVLNLLIYIAPEERMRFISDFSRELLSRLGIHVVNGSAIRSMFEEDPAQEPRKH